MSLKRLRIRERLVETLKGKTAVGDRVFGARRIPLWQPELPCILVYTDNESVQIYSEAPREYKREVSCVVQGLIDERNLQTPLEEALDILGQEIENALKNDQFLGREADGEIERAADLIPTSVETVTENDGQNTVGKIEINLTASYYDKWVRDLSLDAGNLDQMFIEWDIVGEGIPSGNVDATDNVTGIFNA